VNTQLGTETMSSTLGFKLLLAVVLAFLVALQACEVDQHSGQQPANNIKQQPDEVPIGLLVPLTGDVATYGVAIKNGVDLANSVLAESDSGRKMRVIPEDTQANPRIGVTAAQKLIRADEVRAIIGAVASSVTLSVAPIVERSEVVLLSPASSSPRISEAGDFVFRNYPSDSLEGAETAAFALSRNWHLASVFVINNDYGTGLKSVFEHEFERGGGQIVTSDLYNEGISDFRAPMLRVRSRKPDVVFIVGYGRELGTIIRQAREVGVEARFLSTVNFQDPQTLETGGSAVEGAIYSSPIFDPDSKDSKTAAFVERYKARFHQEPDVWAAHGYDALLLVSEACGNTDCTPASIRDYLYALRNWPGVSGETTFNEKGDVLKPVRFMTVIDGSFMPLSR